MYKRRGNNHSRHEQIINASVLNVLVVCLFAHTLHERERSEIVCVRLAIRCTPIETERVARVMSNGCAKSCTIVTETQVSPERPPFGRQRP